MLSEKCGVKVALGKSVQTDCELIHLRWSEWTAKLCYSFSMIVFRPM